MKYFATLPVISQPDFNGNYVTTTNLLSRAYLLEQLKNNIYIYYDYAIKDFDSPESIAYKLYNDTYRYGMVFYANGITDPQGNWPMDQHNFNIYIADKYKEVANVANVALKQNAFAT